MSARRPRVIAVMIVDVEIESEGIVVELHRTVEVQHREHDGYETVGVVSHAHRMPDIAPARRVPDQQFWRDGAIEIPCP